MQICQRMSLELRRGSRGPTKMVWPSAVLIQRPFGACWTLATGRQSPLWQHSCGYHETVDPSGATGVWLFAEGASSMRQTIAMNGRIESPRENSHRNIAEKATLGGHRRDTTHGFWGKAHAFRMWGGSRISDGARACECTTEPWRGLPLWCRCRWVAALVRVHCRLMSVGGLQPISCERVRSRVSGTRAGILSRDYAGTEPRF
jgi:hypothetical protein